MFGISFVPPQGPPPRRVRIETITDAWNLVLSDPSPWALGMLAMIGIVFILEFMLMAVLMPVITLLPSSKSANPASFVLALAGFLVIVILVDIPVVLLQASLQRIGLLRLRGYQAATSDLFKLDGAAWSLISWFFIMVGAGLAILLILGALVAGIALLVHSSPAAPAIGLAAVFIGYPLLFVVSFIVQALVAFVPLIIIDQRLSPIDAFRLSIRTFWPHTLMVIVVLFVAAILAEAGLIACGVGIFITAGISFAVVPIMYNDFFRPVLGVPVTGEISSAGPTFDV